ncbi:MAG: ABC transporter ATP-binding protein [Clostridiales bacterium]|nr:ABC transporter ATP-binding protein [Clostridiales bacterium]
MEKALAIDTRDLTKSYGRSRGICNLDLQVEAGDFFGFIGPNGAGKSTTIRTLLGLIQPTSGSASVLGYDIVSGKEKILLHTGYLPSEIHFYPHMKVRDAIRYSADLRKTDCGKRAEELCRRLDLDPGRKVDDLSLGNRKKVGIICAVQHHPDMLILDEPTSGLDPLMQKEFFTILQEENQRGATIFFSSHILSEVQAYCRSAAFIKDGKILLADKVGNLEQTGTRKVCVIGEVEREKLAALPGVTFTDAGTNAAGTTATGTEANTYGAASSDTHDGSAAGCTSALSFLYNGDIQRLLSALAQEKIKDITITEPSLEEIFMHYYEN